LWHSRLGHINENRIKRLQEAGLLGALDSVSLGTCESCLYGKMTKAPFSQKAERASGLLDLVHTDVCGPMSTSARGGYRYFITFTDDFSRYGYIYLMRVKSESFEKFKEFKSEVENQLNRKIKALRSDRGGEYLSHEFTDYLKECGIVSQWTPPGTPQWNGVSERRNRTLLDMVRSMTSEAQLPHNLWGYALETAAFILNRVPSKSVRKTPYEIWKGRVPNMSFLKIWGCEVFVKKLTSDKLEPKSDKCFFVGYPKETKGYYFYHPSENKVVVARTGVFLEKEFLERRSSGSSVQLEEVQDVRLENEIADLTLPSTGVSLSGSADLEPQDVVEQVERTSRLESTQVEESPQDVVEEVPQVVAEPTPSIPVLRRSTRVIRAPDRYLGLHTMDELEDPVTYEEAISRSDSRAWHEAMESEIKSMHDNQVWDLVDQPQWVSPLDVVEPSTIVFCCGW
jgi:transposase InsO family protein